MAFASSCCSCSRCASSHPGTISSSCVLSATSPARGGLEVVLSCVAPLGLSRPGGNGRAENETLGMQRLPQFIQMVRCPVLTESKPTWSIAR